MDTFVQDAEKAVGHIIAKALPGAGAPKIEVRPGQDHDGDPSLFVKVVFQKWPEALDPNLRFRIVSDFRNWLSEEKSDDRFPYFDLLDQASEAERSQPEPLGPAN